MSGTTAADNSYNEYWANSASDSTGGSTFYLYGRDYGKNYNRESVIKKSINTYRCIKCNKWYIVKHSYLASIRDELKLIKTKKFCQDCLKLPHSFNVVDGVIKGIDFPADGITVLLEISGIIAIGRAKIPDPDRINLPKFLFNID